MTYIKLPEETVLGVFLRRLNRFMVEVEVNGKKRLAHLPNSGRLTTVLSPRAKAFLIKRFKGKRKSQYDLFAVERSDTPIIVDTRFSNHAAKKAIENGWIPSLRNYHVSSREPRTNGSRIDFLLERNGHRFYLEVKSVTHAVGKMAKFPDAPTLRGRKHLKSLMGLVEQGFGAGILFSVQRPDVQVVKPNYEIDPKFSVSLWEAVEKNVKILSQMLIFHPPGKVELRASKPGFSF